MTVGFCGSEAFAKIGTLPVGSETFIVNSPVPLAVAVPTVEAPVSFNGAPAVIVTIAPAIGASTAEPLKTVLPANAFGVFAAKPPPPHPTRPRVRPIVTVGTTCPHRRRSTRMFSPKRCCRIAAAFQHFYPLFDEWEYIPFIKQQRYFT